MSDDDQRGGPQHEQDYSRPAPPPPYGQGPTQGSYAPPPSPGQPYPSYGQYGAYAPGLASGYAPPPQNTSALVLTIASGISLVFCAGLLTIPSLILGIIALTRNAEDPADSRRKSRLGWILFAVAWVVTVAAVIAVIAVFVVGARTGGGTAPAPRYTF